jgi:hypothetical protein
MGGDATAVEAIGIALRVAQAIEATGGAYFVGGSLASSLQGEPRATNDIVLDLPIGRIGQLVSHLGADFEVDTDMLLHGRSCNIFFLPEVMKIYLFGVGPAPYDQQEFERRRRVPVDASGGTLVLMTPEDTVLRKLLWHREGGHLC